MALFHLALNFCFHSDPFVLHIIFLKFPYCFSSSDLCVTQSQKKLQDKRFREKKVFSKFLVLYLLIGTVVSV